MTREARQFRCPENVLGWIPWYADGGLSAQQKGQVEAHAAECSDCRAELDIVAGAPFEIDMDLPDPERLFDEITARIDAGERDSLTSGQAFAFSPPTPPTRSLADHELDRIGRWILDPSMAEGDESEGNSEDNAIGPSGSPRVLQRARSTDRSWLVAAAAALAILFLGGIGGVLLSSSESELFASFSDDNAEDAAQGVANTGVLYQAATVASEVATGEDAAPMLDVVFLDSASLREVSDALRAVGVEIVSGPTSLGVYRVQLTGQAGDGREPTAADVAAIANRLKAPGSAVAIFAEAIP